MTTLASRLGETSHVSPLLRRARALGFRTPGALLSLAVARGCLHYAAAVPDSGGDASDPGKAALSHEELAILLLLGELPFNAVAIRCAAQLLSGAEINPARVATLARQQRCGRVLAHIARAGVEHDAGHAGFWRGLLDALGDVPPVRAGVLPHWTRFVAMTGVHRHRRRPTVTWLRPLR